MDIQFYLSHLQEDKEELEAEGVSTEVEVEIDPETKDDNNNNNNDVKAVKPDVAEVQAHGTAEGDES